MPNSRSPQILIVALLSASVLFLGACDSGPKPGSGEFETAQVIIASTAFTQSSQGEGTQERLADLQRTLETLREETSSGWVGRQDDITGYLGELLGGRFFGDQGADDIEVIQALMDRYGQALFGATFQSLELGAATDPDATGSTSIRAEQVLDGVPVLDGQLIFTIGDAANEPRVNAVRGRVFPNLATVVEPTFSAQKAVKSAQSLSGGLAQGEPRLVILPGAGGELAWEITIVASEQVEGELTLSDGLYYLSASTGDLLNIRQASAHGKVALPTRLFDSKGGTGTDGSIAQFATGDSVEVSGENPIGGTLTAQGTVTQNGIALVDTTVPTYDPSTGDGGIYTYDAGGSDDESNLPGQLYVSNSPTIQDPEALAAQSLSRVVYDYYASLGRSSWDGAGGSLISTVNFGGGNFCNSFFSSSLQPPQMVYGNPCEDSNGLAELSEVEIDTAGHEITHGVTDTSSGLIYSGQSGAMNESFSDYFGNVIGNALKGSDTAELFEGGCIGFSAPTGMCRPNPEGGLSLRYMLNGNTFADYLYILNPPHRLRILGVNQDSGGVHLNSSIWNNALWSIRSRLAQIEGASGNDSQLASDFDKIIYATLTTKLGPSSGFLDARAAIEETIVESGADPTVLRVTQEIFDFNKICSGCADPTAGPGQIVTASPQTQLAPSVYQDKIVWIDLNQGDGVFGFPAQVKIGDTPANLSSTPETSQVVFAGDSVITLELPGVINRYDSAGAKTELDQIGLATLAAGLAGSDDGAAWANPDTGIIRFIDPAGTLSSADIPNLGGESVVSVGTGGGKVAMGTDGGSVLFWEPGGEVTVVGSAGGAILATATNGDRILSVTDTGEAVLFDSAGGSQLLSEDAIPFGAAMNGEYAIWTNSRGALEGGVARTEGAVFPDTDLYMYSWGTGTTYDLMQERGQQGFPAISGDRIVWQDSVFGGDDILTATIPTGL